MTENDGKLTAKEPSETAATVGKKLFPDSGEQLYRALLRTAMGGNIAVDVRASTGDEAAEKALREAPGSFVMNVAPAPKQPKKG